MLSSATQSITHPQTTPGSPHRRCFASRTVSLKSFKRFSSGNTCRTISDQFRRGCTRFEKPAGTFNHPCSIGILKVLLATFPRERRRSSRPPAAGLAAACAERGHFDTGPQELVRDGGKGEWRKWRPYGLSIWWFRQCPPFEASPWLPLDGGRAF